MQHDPLGPALLRGSVSRAGESAIPNRQRACNQGFLIIRRIANDRAGHAMITAAAGSEFGADDRDDLNAFLAQQVFVYAFYRKRRPRPVTQTRDWRRYPIECVRALYVVPPVSTTGRFFRASA